MSLIQETNIEQIFIKLVNQWRAETRRISSSSEIFMHPAYQQIIGLGKDAIPLLLKELEQKSGRWFWALKSITREDPVPLEHRGNIEYMIKAWLEWGHNNNYQW